MPRVRAQGDGLVAQPLDAKVCRSATRLLAQLHRADLIPRAHMVSLELRPLRDLLRTRLHLVEKRTSAKNSVQRLLEKYNEPEPDRLPAEATLQASLYAEQIELLGDQIHRVGSLRPLDPVLLNGVR